MNLKFIFAGVLSISATTAIAVPTYDDWDKVSVPVTVDEQHYGGNYQCSYTQMLYGVPIGDPGGWNPRNYSTTKFKSQYIADSLVPKPAITVFDLYHQLTSTGYVTNPNHPYSCKSSVDLPKTYVEKKVTGTKIEKRPRQPFPQYVTYEYMNCNTDLIRQGSLYIAGFAGASTMLVSDITNSAPSTFYSGPVTPWIAVNTSEFGFRTFSVKLDNGSSYYLNVQVPVCTGGINDPVPV